MRKCIFAACMLIASCTAPVVDVPEAPDTVEESLTKVTISASNTLETKTTLIRDGSAK